MAAPVRGVVASKMENCSLAHTFTAVTKVWKYILLTQEEETGRVALYFASFNETLCVF
jgi:hypothetical protein